MTFLKKNMDCVSCRSCVLQTSINNTTTQNNDKNYFIMHGNDIFEL
jgi:hypothetical protein